MFQGESVIMTFQFHPENIPFFRCLRAQTSSSSEQNIKKFSAGSAEVPSVMNDIVGAMLWWDYNGLINQAIEHTSSRGWLSWSDIIPWGGGRGMGGTWQTFLQSEDNRDKITEQGHDWSASLLLQITTHLVSHLNWLQASSFTHPVPVPSLCSSFFLWGVRGVRCVGRGVMCGDYNNSTD